MINDVDLVAVSVSVDDEARAKLRVVDGIDDIGEGDHDAASPAVLVDVHKHIVEGDGGLGLVNVASSPLPVNLNLAVRVVTPDFHFGGPCDLNRASRRNRIEWVK